jgi:hypothetical protein
MFGPFTQLDGEAIETNVTAWWKFAWKAEKTFDGKVSVLLQMRSDINQISA